MVESRDQRVAGFLEKAKRKGFLEELSNSPVQGNSVCTSSAEEALASHRAQQEDAKTKSKRPVSSVLPLNLTLHLSQSRQPGQRPTLVLVPSKCHTPHPGVSQHHGEGALKDRMHHIKENKYKIQPYSKTRVGDVGR